MGRHSDNASSTGDNKFGNTYGLSTQFLETLGINGSLSTRVFVANVCYFDLSKPKLNGFE